jgi:hypothetical protein
MSSTTAVQSSQNQQRQGRTGSQPSDKGLAVRREGHVQTQPQTNATFGPRPVAASPGHQNQPKSPRPKPLLRYTLVSPQESSFPTKEQWQAKHRQSTARNAAHEAEQQELPENANFMVAPIPESQQQYKDSDAE